MVLLFFQREDYVHFFGVCVIVGPAFGIFCLDQCYITRRKLTLTFPTLLNYFSINKCRNQLSLVHKEIEIILEHLSH